MISLDEVIKLGILSKPHGIKGEIAATLDYDIDLSELKCIVVPIDNILVPFFIDAVRPKSSETVLIKIDDIDNEDDARNLCGLDYYALKSDVDMIADADENGGYISDFVGYVLTDENGNEFGKIIDYDDTTENLLFIVETAIGGKRIYVPVAEDLIESIDPETHTISMVIPQGLTEL